MATDELSTKLNRRLQIEEGVQEPVAVDAPGSGSGSGQQEGAEEKRSTANADSELGAKLLRREELNDGQAQPCQPSMKVFNPYTEFKEFSRKQIKDMEKIFKTYDVEKDNFIDLMELKMMMEKLGAPQTHLGLKNMMKEVDEDLDNKLSFREFLLIFRKAAAGELAEDSGLSVLARLTEIDVSTEGVKGAKTFFEAKLHTMANVLGQQPLMKDQNNTENGVKAEASSGQAISVKASRTHNELHKELLLAHKRGLALSSRSELQQVLERRKRVQSDQEEGESRTPLEDVLLRRQQRQLEREKEEEEKVGEEAQLMEFVRVRQNLRKIHSAIQNKAANS
ncbi:hypothetical protein L3Q82_015571 [Scortum barcoo]|uniref:Uncharacterized protein n=1 Tax=Scortum barcoo TaxID=214431 RepID=A0ACB8VNP7_9TELE|nr:hypothetical protein L3Q82_015571 [Scortum barcoo]